MKIDRNFLFILSGRTIQVLVSILAIRLMTSLLPKTEVGYQFVIYSIILGFNLALINPFTMFVNRHIHEWVSKNQFVSALGQMNRYFLVVSLISFFVVFLLKGSFAVATEQPTLSLALLVVAYTYLGTWFLNLVSFFNLFNHQRQFVTLNILAQVVGLGASILFVHVYEFRAFYWLLGLLAGQTISLILGAVLIKRHHFFGQSMRQVDHEKAAVFTKEAFQFSYPVALATIFMWFQTQGYRISVEKNLGPEILAGLGIGLGIAASLASVVESLTTQYFYPKYYSAINTSSSEERNKAWEIVWRAAIGIYIPAAFVVMAVSAILIRLLTAPAFHQFGSYVCAGAAIELIRQLTNIVYLVGHSEKKTHINIVPYLSGAVLLGAGLYFLTQLDLEIALKVDLILALLVSSYLLTFIFISYMAKKQADVHFYLSEIWIILALALPLLLVVILIKDVSVITVLGSVAVGFYGLGILNYQLKKLRTR